MKMAFKPRIAFVSINSMLLKSSAFAIYISWGLDMTVTAVLAKATLCQVAGTVAASAAEPHKGAAGEL